jgi:hypothetical protein
MQIKESSRDVKIPERRKKSDSYWKVAAERARLLAGAARRPR